MGLFKTAEEKQAAKEEKVMKMLRKYGLDDLKDPKDIESVRTIMYALAGSGLSQFGALLTGDDVKVNVRVLAQYCETMVEQNFMIIRMLDKLNK